MSYFHYQKRRMRAICANDVAFRTIPLNCVVQELFTPFTYVRRRLYATHYPALSPGDPMRFGTVWAASYFGIRGNLGRGLVEAAGGDRLHLRLGAGGTLIPRLRPGSGRHMIPSEHASHSRKLLYDLHCFLSSDRNLVAYG
jgi:hypothetical protein